MQRYLAVLRQLKDFDENLTREIAARAYQEQKRVKLEVRVFNALAKKTRVVKTVTSQKSTFMKLWDCLARGKNQNSSLAKIQPISGNWWGNISTV